MERRAGRVGGLERWRGREAYGEGAVGNRLTVNGNVEPMRAFASVRGMRMLKTCHYALHCVIDALWHAEQCDMSYHACFPVCAHESCTLRYRLHSGGCACRASAEAFALRSECDLHCAMLGSADRHVQPRWVRRHSAHDRCRGQVLHCVRPSVAELRTHM